jgi:hypothetical protein
MKPCLGFTILQMSVDVIGPEFHPSVAIANHNVILYVTFGFFFVHWDP